MALIVQKYGGSSLSKPRKIKVAAQRVASVKRSGKDVIVVCSAMGRMTDHLISLAQRTVSHPPQRELDMLMTAGERISMALLAMALDELGIPAISFTGSQGGIVTTPQHTEARILEIRGHRIETELAKGRVVIIAGFQGVSEAKEVTTLGRGGSDTTAVALAATLRAELCEILTDVDGLFSADPRVVPQAKLIPQMSYDEALEYSCLGAKMHARSIALAKRYQVPLRIGSSSRTDSLGTSLTLEGDRMERPKIRGIATKDGFHYFCLPLSLDQVADILTAKSIPLRFFAHTEFSTQFLCEESRAGDVHNALATLSKKTTEEGQLSIVSVVGEGVSAPEVLELFLSVLKKEKVPYRMLNSNASSITAAVPKSAKERFAKLLHEVFIEK